MMIITPIQPYDYRLCMHSYGGESFLEVVNRIRHKVDEMFEEIFGDEKQWEVKNNSKN